MNSLIIRPFQDTPTIFGIRMSLIGDTIMVLPMLNYFSEKYERYNLIFSIAKKCQQAKELYLQDKRITAIKISDKQQSLGDDDYKIIRERCHIFINPRPEHPFALEQNWYDYRNCVDETLFMGGINPDEVSDKYPKLYQYWESPEKHNCKNICIWPFAGYGATQMAGVERSPSKEWWESLIKKLISKGYNVFHFGMDNEPDLSDNKDYKKFTNLSFFKQVQLSLCCGFAIGTDSGSMWVLGAYNKIPQINLLTNWEHNHNRNFLALAPVSKKCINLFAKGGCDNINKEKILEQVNKL